MDDALRVRGVERIGNLVDGAYVRMVQRGRSFRFPPESAEGLRVVGEFVGQELQGDVAAELQVFRLIHHTHTPAADPAEDAVMGDGLPNDWTRVFHRAVILGCKSWASQRTEASTITSSRAAKLASESSRVPTRGMKNETQVENHR